MSHPMPHPAPRLAKAGSTPRIAIVGGGFSGSLLAAHLLRLADSPITIQLIEAQAQPGPGLAYGTQSGAHLLNVRAQNMSAFPDDPAHFLRWLARREGCDGADAQVDGHSFVARATYGAYIRHVLAQAGAEAPPHARLETVQGNAVALTLSAAGTPHVCLADGRVVEADAVALCIGNFPPLPPRLRGEAAARALNSDRFLPNPWDNSAIAPLDPAERVVILGTGLTMVDLVLSLLDQGHRGPITALSRRGLLPHRHAETRPVAPFLHADHWPRTVLDVLIALRAAAKRAEAAGEDWRSAFDALRPHHHALWAGLPLEERRRFLRHARPFWDIHRHRMAPTVADRIAAARASGQLTLRAGRVTGLAEDADGLTITVAGRSGDGRLQADRLINATGANSDYSRVRHPLVWSLLDQGLARPDPLRLGLDVTPGGALIGADGAPSSRILALGPVSKAPFWEMVAVPELRLQCADSARRLLAGLGRWDG